MPVSPSCLRMGQKCSLDVLFEGDRDKIQCGTANLYGNLHSLESLALITAVCGVVEALLERVSGMAKLSLLYQKKAFVAYLITRTFISAVISIT